MHILRRQQFLFAIAGTLFAIGIHCWNARLSAIPKGIHTTADDASYLRPAENFVDYGTWKDNSVGASSFVQRPPLFGIVHLPFYLVFGKSAAFPQLCFFFLLHGVALFHLPGIFRRFISNRQSMVFSWIYAILPCFWGFLSYQITEAMSASLVILVLATALNKGKYSLATMLLLFLCCWMLRPVLILLFPIVLNRIFSERRAFFSGKHWWNIAVLTFSLITFFSWEARKAHYLGSWGDLHPIYHTTNESVFRPVHASLTNVFRIWETKPETFHAIVGSCWSADTTYRSRHFLDRYVEERSIPLTTNQLYSLLNAYSAANKKLLPQFGKNTIKHETPEEIRLRIRFDRLTDSLKSANLARYALITPLQGAREQLLKSQLNLELFQIYYRGVWWVEMLRWACVGMILLSLTLSCVSFFSQDVVLRLLSLGILFFLFYLFYVQRLNEDRYLIPLLPLMYICGMSVLGRFLAKKSVSHS